ncbi:MAG: SpoIIE family protein phosphatase [Clostridia bacterium]|nr:SpoIIE family protein phosphatase [Clostridia bacterium]
MNGNGTREGRSFFDGLVRMIKNEAKKRKNEKGALLFDVAIFLLSLFFARCHIAFGAYPLGAALVGVLPSRVWISLFGVLFGAFSLGRAGIIHAIIAVVIVFLRVIMSGGVGESGTLFRESYTMRVCSVAVGAFVGAIYEILLNSFSLESLTFGSLGVLLSVALAFSYYGVVASEVHISDIIGNGRSIFAGRRGDKEEVAAVMLQGSFLILSFLTAISLDGYDFFGISLSYIFVSALTLFVAKRFGAIRAGAVGFVSAVGLGAMGAVGLGLAGIAAGLLFNIGLGYALFGGAAVLAAWCAYAGGLTVFLSTLPEYAVAAMLMTPYLKGAKREGREDVELPVTKKASLAVLAEVAECAFRRTDTKELEESLLLTSAAIKTYGEGGERGEFDEYRNIVIAATASLDATPCEEKIDILSTRLYKRAPVTAEVISRIFDISEGDAESLAQKLRELVGEYERECYELCRMSGLSREYELISGMMSGVGYSHTVESERDEELSRRLASVLTVLGFPDASAAVIGRRRRRVIYAVDTDAAHAFTDEIRARIERTLGFSLAEPKITEDDGIALVSADALPLWRVEYATASAAASEAEPSGDSTAFFERGGVFHAIISDGMGTGAVAARTSAFAVDYLGQMISHGVSDELIFDALNHIIKYRGEECSTTVDMLSLDLYTGELALTKSGAAPSYVVGEESVFRLAASTAPLGLIKDADSDTLRREMHSGEVVVMISDGAGVLPEESAWLTELLAGGEPFEVEEYARRILDGARKNVGCGDDITVSVIKILAAQATS